MQPFWWFIPPEVVTSVHLKIHCKTKDGWSFDIYLSADYTGGPTWVLIKQYARHNTSFGTLSYDVSSTLDTLDKINDAGLKLQTLSGGVGIWIDHAYLEITTNKDTYTCDVDTNPSNQNWERHGTAPYLDAQDYPNNYINNRSGGPVYQNIAEYTFEDLSL